jgi:hypothetical protein
MESKMKMTKTDQVQYYQVVVTRIDRADSTETETWIQHFCAPSVQKLQRHFMKNEITPDWLEYNE